MRGIFREIGWKRNNKPSNMQIKRGQTKKEMDKWSARRLRYHKWKEKNKDRAKRAVKVDLNREITHAML